MRSGLVPFIFVYDGWGAGIRTPIGRSRVGSPTVERHPNVFSGKYDTLTLALCQAKFWALNDSAKAHPAEKVRTFCSAKRGKRLAIEFSRAGRGRSCV
jgi:hypothetical protein